MSGPEKMSDIARLVKAHDQALRAALRMDRSGLFRGPDGEVFVKTNVPLGQKYNEEVVGIFADEADLDFFYKLYLSE